jgi:hypothetical protein
MGSRSWSPSVRTLIYRSARRVSYETIAGNRSGLASFQLPSPRQLQRWKLWRVGGSRRTSQEAHMLTLGPGGVINWPLYFSSPVQPLYGVRR